MESALLLALLPISIIGLFLTLVIYTLIRALKLQGSEQILWILFILLLTPIGSIFFILANPDKK